MAISTISPVAPTARGSSCPVIVSLQATLPEASLSTAASTVEAAPSGTPTALSSTIVEDITQVNETALMPVESHVEIVVRGG